MTADHDMCEFERQRMELIEKNKQRMKELNLQFMLAHTQGSSKPAPKPRMLQKRVSTGPVRQSARKAGTSIPEGDDAQPAEELFDDDDWLVDDDNRAKHGTGGPRKVPREKSYTGAREFELPPAFDKHGNQLPRRRSCHICTQCPASWRGNFSMPLACTTCPLIFCSRCLFHINGADDISESHDFIDEHQGTWQCFMCTETCACQDPKLKSLSKIDRHKARGWVGVTGGFTGAAKRPTSRRTKATEQPILAESTDAPSSPADSEADTVSIPEGWKGSAAPPEEASAESARKDAPCCSPGTNCHSVPEQQSLSEQQSPDAAIDEEGSSAEEPLTAEPPAGSPAMSPSSAPSLLCPQHEKKASDLSPRTVASAPTSAKGGAEGKLETPPQAPPTRPRRASVESRVGGSAEEAVLEPFGGRSRRRATKAPAEAKSSPKVSHKRKASENSSAEGWTGVDALGKRVRAFWPAEKKWFEGTINKYVRKTNTHTIGYDDGDYEHVQLPDSTVVFI